MNRQERAIRKLLEERRRTPKPWVGLVGDGSGAVQVPGHPQMWYVRPKGGGLPLVVRGGSAPFIEGTEVLVGPDPYRRGLVRVLGTYFIDGSSGSGETQNIGPHAASHYEDGSDPVAITTRQVTNGLVYAHTGLLLGVYAGWVVIDNQAVKYAATAIDMTSHVPGSGARYCLIRVNAAGVVSVQDGTPVASVLDLTQADVPLLAAGYSLLAIVRMYYGQTQISRQVSAPDVFDLRFSPRARSGQIALDDLTDVDAAAPTDGQVLTWDDANSEWIAEDAPGASSGDATFTAAYASRPAASNEGDIFLPTDGFVVERDSSTTWVPWGPLFPLTHPVLSDFTWVNQGSATATEGGGGIYLLAPAAGGDSLKILKKAAPATPYTVTIMIIPQLHMVDYNQVGLIWRQSSDGKLITFMMAGEGAGSLRVSKWNSETSHNANYVGVTVHNQARLWMRITDDGTDRKCSWSNNGQNFIQIHSVGRTDFATCDEIGFYADSNNATYPAALTLLSWKVT